MDKVELRHWGMHVTAAESARDSLQLLDRERNAGRDFPLILLDAQMVGEDGFSVAQTIKGDPSVAGVIIMMLSSLDLRADSIRCRDLAIPFLAKPVTPSDLRQAIENALGASPPDLARLARATTPHPSSGLRVLLAEDNAINQKLATRLLEKRGYSVIVACDGRRAIEEFHKQRFDLALMDLQMPLMGGFETTASIREIERETSGRLPIIALTAHAMNERRSPALYRGGYGWLCFKANSGGRAIWQNRRIAEG